MNHPRHYTNKEVVVLGLARSGVAVAKLFHEQGAAVTVNDKKERHLCPEADELEALGISVICGSHPDRLIHPGVKLMVKNPGIPYHSPPVARALELGIPVVTEVEVASFIAESPIIGITGSNGKTTTTSLVGSMLREAGLQPVVAGNIGRALCDAAMEAGAGKVLVAELSSFQLKGTCRFHPHIAALLNVCPTHLDYHGGMEDYRESKSRLFNNQTADDIAVLNWDDPYCRSLAGRVAAKVLPFSFREKLERGVYLSGGGNWRESWIVHRDEQGEEQPIMQVRELGIPGAFNVENALAASAIALGAGADRNAVAAAMKAFKGVEHRLEFVGMKAGIAFYNNSKATNSDAAVKSIESFEEPVILIAGGQDRGLDFMDMIPCLRSQVKAVVSLGETREQLAAVARKAGVGLVVAVEGRTGDAAGIMQEAVGQAYALAGPGDTVLLSPACASWDMFASYEERGSMFKQSVHNLK